MDWSTLQQDNFDLNELLKREKKLSKQIAILNKQRQHAQQDIDRYQRLIEESKSKIDTYNDPSILERVKYLFQNKNELISQELQLAAIREAKLIDTQVTYDDLNEQLTELKRKLAEINLDEVKARLQINEVQLSMALQMKSPQHADTLSNLQKEAQLAMLLEKELQEAILAGEDAIRALVDASQQLQDTKNYSTLDLFFGGGIYATYLKHEKIRVSNSFLHRVQRKLQMFQNELLDVTSFQNRTLNIDVDGFVTFSDYFFGDIFSEWSVHTKISDANNQIYLVMDDVNNTLTILKNKRDVLLEKQQTIRREMDSIFTSNF